MDHKPKARIENDRDEENREASATMLGHLDQTLGYVLRRAQLAVFHDFHRAFARFDIRPSQYAVLSVIADNPGLQQGKVSHLLGIKRANFVVVLDALQARGLTLRTRSPDDKRAYCLSLTEAGQTVMRDMRRENAETEAKIAALLPEGGHQALLALLRQLTEKLNASAGKAALADDAEDA